MKDTVVVAFGRMNPVTQSGHGKLLAAMKKSALKNKADMFFAVSKTQDKKKNPLEYSDKVKFIKQMFPEYSKNLLDSSSIKTPIDLLKHFSKKYKKIIFIAGSDRVPEYEKLFNAYNGKDYEFESIVVESAGERDPDADGAEGMSASKMRALAVANNYEQFSKEIKDKKLAKQIYDAVRIGMGINESKLLTFKEYKKLQG